MTKRLTVVYEVPDDYNVTRITGTGELVVVRCEWMDALAQLAAAEAEKSLSGSVTESLLRAERDEAMRLLTESIDSKVALEENGKKLAQSYVDDTRGLREKITQLEQQLAAAEAQLADINNSFAIVMNEQCAPDERHCTCVPVLRAQLAAAEAECDIYKSRCICELAHDDDEAEHECGWQVCGVCWNNACAAHKKVADQLQGQLATAEKDRDEARKAARWLLGEWNEYDTAERSVMARWPWLKAEETGP